MLSQQAEGEGGVIPSRAETFPVEAVAGEGAKINASEQKHADIGCCGSGCSAEGIAERATTITPLLAEILTHKSTPTLGEGEGNGFDPMN